ncbi:MAG: hypothetical protein WAO58_07190 [Fimbriimonadaceae bacterium]
MITAAICFALLSQTAATQPSTIDLIPTDDVWVYPNAGDPSKDAYLRFWGAGGKSVPGPGESAEDFSYSYLKWSLRDLPDGAKVTSATLILTHVANSQLSAADIKASPVEVRALSGGFTEKGWSYATAEKIIPDRSGVFGKGGPASMVKDKETLFEINLALTPTASDAGSFRAYFERALAGEGKELGLALVSAVDPSSGSGAIYKIFSKDGPKEFRPVLRLVFEK